MRLDAAGAHSFFLTWTWIGTWLRCVPCPQTMLLRATRGDEVVGLALLTLNRATRTGMLVKQRRLNTTGDPAYDSITIEHNGFAHSSVGADELWNAFWLWLASRVPEDEKLVLAAVDAQVSSAMPAEYTVLRREIGYRTPLQKFKTLEGLLSSLSRNSRQKLRRSLRDYEQEGPLSIEIARDSQTALLFFAKMKELHISSWSRRQRAHAFVHPFFETFHRSLIRRGVADGNVDLIRVCAGNRAIGYLYNFRYGGTVSSYQSGFDDADRQFRPGYVSHALAITHYAASGMSYYDFLAGVNRLKQSYGLERYELCWYGPRSRIINFRPRAVLGKATAWLRSNK